jgi:hypothetical protein
MSGFKDGYFSTDPLKNMIISDIVNSQTREDYNKAKAHAKEEGLIDDEIVEAWIDFRQKLVFTGEGPF